MWGDSGLIWEAQVIDEPNGVGTVYLKYMDPQVAQVALKALEGVLQ
jgi:hypothetical protein